MRNPILTIAFNDDATLLQIRRHDEDVLNEIDWPLAELEDLGYDGACRMIGNAALRLLQRAHPEIYTRHARIMPPPPYVTNTYILIFELIERSHASRTRRYVEAIDALLELHADELSHTSMPAQWPRNREELMQYED